MCMHCLIIKSKQLINSFSDIYVQAIRHVDTMCELVKANNTLSVQTTTMQYLSPTGSVNGAKEATYAVVKDAYDDYIKANKHVDSCCDM